MINSTVTRMDDSGWHFAWLPGVPPYQIYLDGILLDTVSDEEYSFSLPNYEEVPPELEILNAGDVSDGAKYPPYVNVQWRGLYNAINYTVEQYVDGNWEVEANVTENGSGYYHWQSPPLEDATTQQFRVTAQDLIGNQGTPVAFAIDVCRHPLAPRIVVGFSSSGDLVVADA